MIYVVLTIYVLSAINVLITEKQVESSWLWCLFLAVVHPVFTSIGGLLWLLVGIEKLIFRVFERKHQ